MIILHRRRRCHYCGRTSGPIDGSRFQCQNCLADNFLDENGEVADVPPEIASSTQYAVPLGHTSSVQSVFCSTCLKNQTLHADALSQFLPDSDDPEYERFEDALPEFKKRLEEQYPQCCRKCEPKVKAQLQQATYNARSDHLRRMLNESRSGRISNGWGWRSLVVKGAGVTYVVSLSVQLLWHALGSQSTKLAIPSVRPTDCLAYWPVPLQCSDLVERFMGVSLLLAVLVVWWNPKWQHKIKGNQGRLVGITDFYKAQTATLVLRFVAWLVLRDVPGLERYRPILHSFFLVFIALTVGYTNLGLIKVDTTPLVNWHQDPTPLLVTDQFEIPDQSKSSPGCITMSDFQSTQQQPEAWQPPKPLNDEDLMDWAPSPAMFVPQPKQITYKATQKSPFVGTLPALPRQGIYPSKTYNLPEPSKAIGIPIGFFEKSSDQKRTAKAAQAGFAQPRFFPSDQRADTGLENIFGKVFSLEDAAVEVRRKSSSSSNTKSSSLKPVAPSIHPARSMLSSAYFRTIVIALQSGVTGYIMLDSYVGSLKLPKISGTIFAVVVVSMSEAAPRLAHDYHASVAETILILAEHTALLALAICRPAYQSLLLPLWTKLVVGILCFMLMNEVLRIFTNGNEPEGSKIVPQEDVAMSTAKHLDLDEVCFTTRSEARPRRESVDSISSVSSIQSTSTASGWKTPVMNHREHVNTPRSIPSSGSRMGNLDLEDFSVGGTVAGPRSRAMKNNKRSK